MRRFVLLALLALACGSSGDAAPPRVPLGFDTHTEQRLRFEAEETIDLDGAPVKSRRFAVLALRAKPDGVGGTDLEVYVERYYARIDGAPGGESELSIDEKGLASKSPGESLIHLDPNQIGPDGSPVYLLRDQPAAYVTLDGDGVPTAEPEPSLNPVWMGIPLLDWILLAFPTRAPEGGGAWTANRSLPTLGQYALGMAFPVRWEPRSEKPGELRASASTSRARLNLAPSLAGSVTLDSVGEADVDPDGRVREARLELTFRFASETGTRVQSRHVVRVRALDDAPVVNSPLPSSDTPEVERAPQQGHLDHLPHHGGVRRRV